MVLGCKDKLSEVLMNTRVKAEDIFHDPIIKTNR